MAHDVDFVNALAEALQGVTASRSIGEEWHSFTGVIPLGGVPYNGQMLNRETYPELWEYVQAQNLVKTEAEWQTLTGDIPYYSDGDGSTTFRMPKITDTIIRGVYAFGAIVNSGEVDVLELSQNRIPVSGLRGILAGYETVGSNTVIDANAPDSNETDSDITVSNGMTGTSWTKTVRVTAEVVVTLGDSWSWMNGEEPTITAGGILVCMWCGSGGIVGFISP